VSYLESRVRACYETAPFPNILQGATDFEGTIRLGVEWAMLNWRGLGFDWQAIRPSTVLCAGCGTGEEAIVLSRLLPDATIHAIDISEPSLAIARQNADKAMVTNITFLQLSILEDLPSLLFSYDLVYCSGVIHHLRDPQKGFGILLNSVSKDGHVIFSLYNTYGLLFYKVRLLLLDFLAGDDQSKRITWTLRLGFHDGGNKATLWDSFVHPQVTTYTIGQVRRWASTHSRILSGIAPPLTIPGLFAYALTGQHFALRRQWLIKLVLQFAQTFFRGPDSAVGTVPARLPVSSSPLRDFLFQIIYFILGKGECFYMIRNM